jgi:predicted metalloprotease with PDZ domain
MGFLAEGVTTYMGDLLLMKSGVFDFDEYFNEFNTQLQRHFDNFGRFNYSVAESSFDTWLDGYTPGAPGRKVSIYTEGCLLAFVTDVSIMKATANKRKLDDVMRSLYNKYGKKGIGVSEADYKAEIANVSGTSMDWLFDQYINGTKAFEGILTDCLDYLGLELMNEPSSDYAAARLGVKAILLNNQLKTMAIFPGSPYDIAGGMVDDEILAVNDVKINNDFNQWLEFFENSSKKITVNRKGRMMELFLPEVSRTFYQRYWVQKLADPYKLQRDALGQWRK